MNARQKKFLPIGFSLITALFITTLIIVLGGSSEDSLQEYLQGVDATETTPVLLRYRFEPGQEFGFESTMEVVTTYRLEKSPGSGALRLRAKPVFVVETVDSEGNATIEVTLKELEMDSTAGAEHRMVQMTPESVRVYYNAKEVSPAEEDFKVQKALMAPFKIVVSPHGEVSTENRPGDDKTMDTTRFQSFFCAHIFKFPEDEVAPGAQWDAELPRAKELPGAPDVALKCVFLGYKVVEGERCAVVRTSFSLEAPIVAQGEEETQAQQGHLRVNAAGGVVFSTVRNLPLIIFNCQETTQTQVSFDKQMFSGSTDEEYVMKLVSGSRAGR